MNTPAPTTTEPRPMRTPRPGQVYNRDIFWARIDADRARDAEGRQLRIIHTWAFDFISIHRLTQTEGEPEKWNLCSPMILRETAPDGYSPAFEAVSFPTQRDAIAAAKEICFNRRPDHLIFIVIVDGQKEHPRK